MKASRMIAAPVVLLIAACGGGGGTAKDAQLEEYGKAEVRKLLRDPASADFTGVSVSRKSGNPAICGYVNSNNGLGGKTGPQRFVSGGATAIEEQMAPGAMNEVWAKLC